ncbi:MAG TPA: hypothetical protein DCM73_00135 [Clostridiales bacterium]|nr:hypothetical protein [Clostridiales bacterium]
MKDNRFKIFTAVFILMFACYFYFAVENVQKSNENEKFDILSDAIKRSAVQCYAIEGFYPPDVEYLEKNYGLVVDYDRYVVNYSIFASNIMPDIEVYLK